jgi:hypothetical protein
MICEAAAYGLQFDGPRLRKMLGAVPSWYIPPDPNGPLHNSLTCPWVPLELMPRRVYEPITQSWPYRINFFRRRAIPKDADIHESAFERKEKYRKRLPTTARRVATSCIASLGI